jgi:hypothetical protein
MCVPTTLCGVYAHGHVRPHHTHMCVLTTPHVRPHHNFLRAAPAMFSTEHDFECLLVVTFDLDKPGVRKLA